MPRDRSLYPHLTPYLVAHLDVGDGHTLYVERCGTPGGKPAVYLHGGPAAGSCADHRRLFNAQAYDFVIFDQRGCGRSTPHGCTADNTTWHLVRDLERIREFCGFKRWLVSGGSWGSTLALSYAQQHPSRVSELILRGVFLADEVAFSWLYRQGASEIFPGEWDNFIARIPAEKRSDLVTAFADQMAAEDGEQASQLAQAWCAWEASTVSLLPDEKLKSACEDRTYASALAQIQTHYFANKCWLNEDQLLSGCVRLHDIPTTIVHGRYDICCPVSQAVRLSKSLPHAKLQIIEGAGHAAFDPKIRIALLNATDAFALSKIPK